MRILILLFCTLIMCAQQTEQRGIGPVWPQEGNGRYKSYFGRDTHTINGCVPGKVESGNAGMDKDVPCSCQEMVDHFFEQVQDKCGMFTTREERIKCYKENQALCEEIVDSPEYKDLWGKNNRNRCQTYCINSSCKCCDGRFKRTRTAANFGTITLTPFAGLGFTPVFVGNACQSAVTHRQFVIQKTDYLGLAFKIFSGKP